MNIIWCKILSVILIIAAGVTGGIVPLGKRIKKGGNGLTYGNAFAGVIFLGAGLMHILPDSNVC